MTNPRAVAIYETGDPQGPPLLLIHGGGGGVWAWRELLKHLADYRCLLAELPEHGGSRANGPFSISTAARGILAALQDRAAGEPVHVFGHSVGGQVVVEMLALAPETLRSAIISGAQLLPVPGYRLGLYSERVMALVYWLGIAPWKHADAWIRWTMRLGAGIPERFFEDFKTNFQGLTRDSWAHVMSENYRYRLPPGLDGAGVPVLLVAGPHETADIQPTNRLLRRLLPRSRSVLLPARPGWSAAQEHNWPMTDPDLCAQVIRAWTRGNPLPEVVVEAPG